MTNQNEPNFIKRNGLKKIIIVTFLLSFCLLLVTVSNASASTSDHYGDNSDRINRDYSRPSFQSGVIFNFKFDGLFKNVEINNIELKYKTNLDVQPFNSPTLKISTNFQNNAFKNVEMNDVTFFRLTFQN
jgi:hypothetical protein